MLWFGRQSRTRNRRYERRHVLDVKVRSQQVRSQRFGRLARVMAWTFVLLGCGFAAWRGGELGLRHLVYENPAFAIKRVEVQGGAMLQPEWIRHWSGVRLGDNLFALDLERVRSHLTMVALIEEAWVERVLPDALRLRVLERAPVVCVRQQRLVPGGGLERDLYFLDATGFVIKPLPLGEGRGSVPPEVEGMPVIEGLGPFEVRPGVRLQSARVQAALELVRTFEQSPMYGLVDLERVDVSIPDVLLVRTRQAGDITLGFERIEVQLRRWRSIHDEAARQGLLVASLDLSVSNNLPVRWQEPGTPPPLPPRRAVPPDSKTRKPHV